MAGRGRGMIREPMMLRRPLNIEEGLLSKTLMELSLSGKNESEMSAVISEVKKMTTSKESFKKAFSLLYKYSHQSRRHAVLGAMLFKDLINLVVDGVSTRKLLLTMLQSDFEGRDSISPNKFLIQATFLCEIFHSVRLIRGTPVKVLGIAVVDYFEKLLDGKQEEFEVLLEQFPKNAADLDEACHGKVSEFLMNVRKKLVTETTMNTASRIALLCLLECSFKKTTTLEPEVVELYENISNLNLKNISNCTLDVNS